MVVSNNIWANSLGFTNIGLSCTDLSITNNLFLADTGPIVVSASNYGANLEVHNNSFLSNSGTILSLYSGSNSAFMDATQNYWGRINTTEISSMVLDKNDGITYADFIPYLPILTTPDPSTPKCILASAGDGGSITPSGIITFNFGDNRDFNITPNSGYHIADILVNGTSVGAVSSYLMQNIQGVTTISATFAHDTTPTPSPVYPPLSVPMQLVVDSLESKGFDVTFVYFGSNKTLTCGAEDAAVLIMKTFEHVKNFQFTSNQERQFKEGNNTLFEAYPNAEAFLVGLFEDLDNDGTPDGYPQEGNCYLDMSGGGYGGRSGGSFQTAYWSQANSFISTNGTTPTLGPTVTPTVNPTSTPSATVTATPTQTPTVNPTTQPTLNPATQPTQEPTTNPTASPTQNPASLTPTPTIPESSLALILPILALALLVATVVKQKKRANGKQS